MRSSRSIPWERPSVLTKRWITVAERPPRAWAMCIWTVIPVGTRLVQLPEVGGNDPPGLHRTT